MSALSIVLLALLSLAFASPAPLQLLYPRQDSDLAAQPNPGSLDAGAMTEWPIHSSCNASEARQLRAALDETVQLAEHAKNHVLRWGNSSEHYQKYFGDAPSGDLIGNLDKVVNGDRGSVLFRCDNPDGNCQLEGWGGHWRGENGTDETVICPLSYETRRSLVQMCALGYNVAESESNTFWASDLIHRLYHMPAFGEGHVEHYAEEGYEGVLELAATNATLATHDSDAIQYFALDVYAYDVAVPGVGCSGPSEATTTGAEEPAVSAASPSSTMPEPASMTSEVPAASISASLFE